MDLHTQTGEKKHGKQENGTNGNIPTKKIILEDRKTLPASRITERERNEAPNVKKIRPRSQPALPIVDDGQQKGVGNTANDRQQTVHKEGSGHVCTHRERRNSQLDQRELKNTLVHIPPTVSSSKKNIPTNVGRIMHS